MSSKKTVFWLPDTNLLPQPSHSNNWNSGASLRFRLRLQRRDRV
jgi:hypothetical protein